MMPRIAATGRWMRRRQEDWRVNHRLRDHACHPARTVVVCAAGGAEIAAEPAPAESLSAGHTSRPWPQSGTVNAGLARESRFL